MSNDVDQLVDKIVERVRARLDETPQGAPRCGECSIRGACDPGSVLPIVEAGPDRVGVRGGPVGGAPCGHLAPFIDHTILKPDATKEELRQVCEEAVRYSFKTVCVNGSNVRFVAACLSGSPVKAIAVVGFPLGAGTPQAKAFETREAIRNGAKEVDMVINIGALKSRDHALVFEDIKAVVEAAQATPVKVILETAKLERDEILMGCALSKAAKAAFVKTSTGFGGGGATPENIALMRAAVGEDMGVKASGGVRTVDDAEQVIAAGASRIGASASVEIVQCKRGGSSGSY